MTLDPKEVPPKYVMRGFLAFFFLFFVVSLLFPVPGMITHIFLSNLGFSPTIPQIVSHMPKILGAFVDSILASLIFGILLAVGINKDYFTPVTKQVLIIVVVIVAITVAILTIDQFYTIPLP